nr:MAG TPA: hypothetical protein [Caudoviricetes sp.]
MENGCSTGKTLTPTMLVWSTIPASSCARKTPLLSTSQSSSRRTT